MIQVKYTKSFGTFSAGDVRSYDDVSAERLIENGFATKFEEGEDEAASTEAPAETPKPSTRRSTTPETVTVVEPS